MSTWRILRTRGSGSSPAPAFPTPLSPTVSIVRVAMIGSALERKIFRWRCRWLHHYEHIAGQGPLEMFDLIPFSGEPEIDFLRCCQDRRHGLLMNWAYNLIGQCGQKSVEFELALAVTNFFHPCPWRPESSEKHQRPVGV